MINIQNNDKEQINKEIIKQATIKSAEASLNLKDLNIVGMGQIQQAKVEQDTSDNSLLNAGSNIQTPNNNFTALALPSNFVFYDFDSLHVRKLSIRDAAKLTKASAQANYKSFKEAIQGCIDRDIEVLTYGDFRYICYWLRVNSYPSTPITIEWTSKYFNKNISTVLKDDVTTLLCDMTKERFKEWQDKGFDVPRMKFSNAFDKEVDEETAFIYKNAIYFKGNTWEEKMNNLDNYIMSNGLDAVKVINKFDKELEHGVEEYVTVIDLKFDVNEYKAKLEDKIKRFAVTLSKMENKESKEYLVLEVIKEEAQSDYEKLLDKMSKQEVVQAEPEKIFLDLGPDELLSPLYR